jgi:hypothetical protein
MSTKLGAGAAVALMLVLASVTFATASSDDISSHSDDRETIVHHLLAKEVAQTYVDLGDADFSQADQFVFTNDLFRGDARVGEDGGVCTVTRVGEDGSTTVYCNGSNSLPGGQVTVQGLIFYGPGEEVKQDPYSLAITGGTGEYRTAHGEAVIRELSATEFRLTLRIILEE